MAGARYAALGVIGDDRSLSDFVPVGIDSETVARIGHLPALGGKLSVNTDAEGAGAVLEWRVPLGR